MKTRTQLVLLAPVSGVGKVVQSLCHYRRRQRMMPAVIMNGQAHAPNQYRLLFPVLWKVATSMGIGSQVADQTLVICSIVFCYAVLVTVLYCSCPATSR